MLKFEDIISLALRMNIKNDDKLRDYVNFCFSNDSKDGDVKHHILPKSIYPEFKNLSIYQWNCSRLSFKDHLIAHYLLAQAVKNKSVSFSLIAMLNKDPVLGRFILKDLNLDKIIISEIKEIVYTELAKKSKGNVTCIKDGITLRVPCYEYKCNKELYSTHSDNKIRVFNIGANEFEYINTEEYYRNKNNYTIFSSGKLNIYNTFTGKKEYISLKEYDPSKHIKISKRTFVLRDKIFKISLKNLLPGDIILPDNEVVEGFEENFSISFFKKESCRYPISHYKKFFNFVSKKYVLSKVKRKVFLSDPNKKITVYNRIKNIKEQICGLDFNKNEHAIIFNTTELVKKNNIIISVLKNKTTLEKYSIFKSNVESIVLNDKFHTKNKKSVINILTNKKEYISLDEFNKDIHINKGIGMCTCKDDSGISYYVSKDEFKKNGFKGHNFGMISCRKISNDEKVRLTSDEYQQNKHLYYIKNIKRGEENKKVKIVKIYDNNRNLIYISKIGLKHFCKENNLSFKLFYNSLKTKKPISENTIFTQFRGWYAEYE